VNPDSPVLPKWAFALAMRAVEPALGATPREMARAENYVLWYKDRAHVERILLAARLTTIAVTVLAGALLWSVALRFGPVAGAVTHALWCFSPAVLAAGSLATLDAWVTASVIAPDLGHGALSRVSPAGDARPWSAWAPGSPSPARSPRWARPAWPSWCAHGARRAAPTRAAVRGRGR
jgi:hypothetical protein